MHSGMSIHYSIALMIMHIHGISLPLFVSWLGLDNQSAMNSCGPGLHSIFMLYWWIYNSILCSLCDRHATSFFKIATSGLWCVIMLTLQVKHSGRIFLGHIVCLKSSLSILQLKVSANVRLLLMNAIGNNALLLGVSFLESCMLYLTCRRVAPRPTHDASVSRYSCSFSL